MGQPVISNYIFLQQIVTNQEFHQFIRKIEDEISFRCNTETTCLHTIKSAYIQENKQERNKIQPGKKEETILLKLSIQECFSPNKCCTKTGLQLGNPTTFMEMIPRCSNT